MERCSALTHLGNRCKNARVFGSLFCGIHKKVASIEITDRKEPKKRVKKRSLSSSPRVIIIHSSSGSAEKGDKKIRKLSPTSQRSLARAPKTPTPPRAPKTPTPPRAPKTPTPTPPRAPKTPTPTPPRTPIKHWIIDLKTLELGARVGRGSYGSVYVLKNFPNKVIKILKNDMHSGFGLPELSELDYLRMFNHPNILRCSEFTVNVDSLGLILPRASADLRVFDKASLSMDTKVKWMYQMASTVNFLHTKGFYNCDIKLANILIFGDDIVMADLGLVRPLQVISGGFCNTYKSPQELNIEKYGKTFPGIFSADTIDIDSDVWALGVAFFQLLRGSSLEFLSIKEKPQDMWMYCNLSATQRRDYLGRQSRIPLPFVDVVDLLLNPEPSIRRNALNILLNFPLFSSRGYTSYIQGTLNEPPLPNKKLVSQNIGRIQAILDELSLICPYGNIQTAIEKSPYPMFNTLDLIYRCVSKIPFTYSSRQIALVFLSVSLKLFKEEGLVYRTAEERELEVWLIKQLDGILSRNEYLFTYLSPLEKVKFFMLVRKDPMIYFIKSADELRQVLNR